MIVIILFIVSIILTVAVIPIMIFTFRGKLQFLQGVLLSAGAMLLSFVASVSEINMKTGQNIIDIMLNDGFAQVKTTFDTLSVEQLQKVLGNVSVEQVAAFRGDLANNLTSILDIYRLLFPSIMILTLLACSFIAFMIIKVILGLFKFDVSKFPMLCEFKISKTTIIALVISLMGTLTYPIYTISGAFLNVAVVIIGVMCVCGFSLFDFQVRKKVDNAWVRVLVYVAIIVVGFSLFSILMYSLVFAAIFDAFVDFRKLSPNKEKKNG